MNYGTGIAVGMAMRGGSGGGLGQPDGLLESVVCGSGGLIFLLMAVAILYFIFKEVYEDGYTSLYFVIFVRAGGTLFSAIMGSLGLHLLSLLI